MPPLMLGLDLVQHLRVHLDLRLGLGQKRHQRPVVGAFLLVVDQADRVVVVVYLVGDVGMVEGRARQAGQLGVGALCAGSVSFGKATPSRLATCISAALALVWSAMIVVATSRTDAVWLFRKANLPSLTSAMLPCASLVMNRRSVALGWLDPMPDIIPAACAMAHTPTVATTALTVLVVLENILVCPSNGWLCQHPFAKLPQTPVQANVTAIQIGDLLFDTIWDARL